MDLYFWCCSRKLPYDLIWNIISNSSFIYQNIFPFDQINVGRLLCYRLYSALTTSLFILKKLVYHFHGSGVPHCVSLLATDQMLRWYQIFVKITMKYYRLEKCQPGVIILSSTREEYQIKGLMEESNLILQRAGLMFSLNNIRNILQYFKEVKFSTSICVNLSRIKIYYDIYIKIIVMKILSGRSSSRYLWEIGKILIS